jgi:L-alanine-DL-glutamate epimerase-like enolase superfamily enzyme
MTALIAELEVIPIVTPGVNAGDCDGAADTVVVRLTDEDGRTGIGEADAPADLVRAFVEQPDLHVWSRNARNLVVGRDPFPIAALVDELYEATLYPGRRGLGIHALSAIDIALHDLVGKQLGRPVYELLGGARKEWLSPYATIFPGLPQGRGLAELLRDIGGRFQVAVEAGFRAVKMECLFYDLVTDRKLVEAAHRRQKEPVILVYGATARVERQCSPELGVRARPVPFEVEADEAERGASLG